MSKIYLEILDEPRQKIFELLSKFKKEGYLAGGTALALQIKHRKSVDFDVFIDKPVTNYLRIKAKKIFGPLTFYIDTSDQISFTTPEDVGVTFVWYIYKPILPLIKTSSIPLASISDIASDKAHTIGRRAVWRDYVDLFLLLKKRTVTMDKIIKLAKKKFSSEFNEALFLEQLSYFKDLDVVPIEFIDASYNSTEIKTFLEKEVEKYIKKVLP